MIHTLALLSALLLQDPAQAKYAVTDGKTGGIFYGMSVIADLWGNYRRQVWTLKPDGSLLFGAPEGGLEDYLQRDFSTEEKANLGTYSIAGDKILMTTRDASKSEGSVEYNDDRSIKLIKASGLRFVPVRAGLSVPLAGYWNNTFSFNNGAFKMSTTVATSYSFMANGLFVHESAACTVATAVDQRTRETPAGIETVRQEVTRLYGGGAGSKMGKFEVKGSDLTFAYDNGTKGAKFVGRLGDVKAGESSLILIGNGLYEGTFGVFPKPSGTPAAAPATGLARCKSEHFDLAVPAGWHARQEDLDGTKTFILTPADDVDGKFSIVLTGTGIDNQATKAGDPEMVAALEVLVIGWLKGEKPEKEGGTETFTMGGVEAARLRYMLVKDGAPGKVGAACAVRGGHAIVALTLAAEGSMKKYGAAARDLLAKTGFPEAAPVPKVELQKVKGDGYDLEIPRSWTSKENEQNSVKTLVIVPPAGDTDYVLQVIPSDAGEHASAIEPGAVQELRQLVTQIAPALKPMGALETLKAGGRPAAGVVYGGRNEKDEVILVKAYLILKAKKAVVLLVVGKETRDKEYGAQVRRIVESLTLK
jgi:hypothetical protein